MGADNGNHTAQQEPKSTERPPWWKRLWRWTKFGEKSGWDWLQLLVVPVLVGILAVILTAWFNNQQSERQQRIETQRAEAERALAEQRAQDEALQVYLDQMSTLLLEKDLRNSKEDSEVRMLARARTLSVLGRLDSERNSAILQFLREAQLISGTDPVVRLSESNLHDAELHRANLSKAGLSYANLLGADLSEANLSKANLRLADLSKANLSKADLSGANLLGANRKNATMPNGQKYEDWRKDR